MPFIVRGHLFRRSELAHSDGIEIAHLSVDHRDRGQRRQVMLVPDLLHLGSDRRVILSERKWANEQQWQQMNDATRAFQNFGSLVQNYRKATVGFRRGNVIVIAGCSHGPMGRRIGLQDGEQCRGYKFFARNRGFERLGCRLT